MSEPQENGFRPRCGYISFGVSMMVEYLFLLTFKPLADFKTNWENAIKLTGVKQVFATEGSSSMVLHVETDRPRHTYSSYISAILEVSEIHVLLITKRKNLGAKIDEV
jgi:hypothetical protein